MLRPPPHSTRTDTLSPSTTLCRSAHPLAADTGDAPARQVDGLGRAVAAARGAEIVAEGRAEGDGAAMLRDQLQPGQRPQRAALGRQVVAGEDRKSVGTGKRVEVLVDIRGPRHI